MHPPRLISTRLRPQGHRVIAMAWHNILGTWFLYLDISFSPWSFFFVWHLVSPFSLGLWGHSKENWFAQLSGAKAWVGTLGDRREPKGAEGSRREETSADTIWLFNIAMEHGPFLDGLPIKNSDFPERMIFSDDFWMISIFRCCFFCRQTEVHLEVFWKDDVWMVFTPLPLRKVWEVAQVGT